MQEWRRMVISKRLLTGLLLICAAGILVFVILNPFSPTPSVNTANLPSISTPLGTMILSVPFPESPSGLTLYSVTPEDSDMAYFSVMHLIKYRPNATPESEAESAAHTALLPYGGLPAGAKFIGAKTEYAEEYDLKTHTVTDRQSISTNVQFYRTLEGRPVVGEGGFIYLDLGNDGELLYLNKVWRTVTPAGNVSIIPASAAVERMKQGDVLGSRPKSLAPLVVDRIGLGYYEKGRNESQEYLEPVWIFAGKLTSGDSWKYYVYARESPGSPPGGLPEGTGLTRTAGDTPQAGFQTVRSGVSGTSNTTARGINSTG